MKSTHKALLLTLCAALLVAASVFGTLAYLTSTDEVVNTFTVGKVELKLDEADVNEDGTYADAEKGHDARVDSNEYLLLPGHTYIKDPTVTVLKNSEDCYVRMKVTVTNLNNLKEAFNGLTYEGAYGKYPNYMDGDRFLLHLIVDGWKNEDWAFTSYEGDVYEFRYVGALSENGIVPKNSEKDTVLPDLFTSITIPGAMNNTQIAKLADVEIVVTAEAIQADGFENNEDLAWEKFENPNAQ